MTNPLSFSSLKLDLFSRDGVHLKSASGFVIEVDSQCYLITNWHVVASGQQEPNAKPHFLKTSVHIHAGTGEQNVPVPLWMGMRKQITVQLYDDSDSPYWIEHRMQDEKEGQADIVALPIQGNLASILFSGKISGIALDKGSQGNNPNYWTKISAIPISAVDTDVEYDPPDTVHVIGYPLGWEPDGTDRTSSAFWRTCFIASEIYEPGTRRTNTFFVDSCPPEGMTGSPVLGMKKDRLKLLGVYSDRSMKEFGASAGLVYGAWLVKELLRTS